MSWQHGGSRCIKCAAGDDDDTSGGGGDLGSTSGSDDLGCKLNYNPVDVWSIELSASEVITVSVDTVAADTAFDPALSVLDGLSLDSEHLDDNDEFFDCTFAPVEYRCPQVELTMAPGTYAIVVLSYGNCTGTVAEYQLAVVSAAGTPVTPTLIADDVVPPSR